MRKFGRLVLALACVMSALGYATVASELHQHARGRVCWLGLFLGVVIGVALAEAVVWLTRKEG